MTIGISIVMINPLNQASAKFYSTKHPGTSSITISTADTGKHVAYAKGDVGKHLRGGYVKKYDEFYLDGVYTGDAINGQKIPVFVPNVGNFIVTVHTVYQDKKSEVSKPSRVRVYKPKHKTMVLHETSIKTKTNENKEQKKKVGPAAVKKNNSKGKTFKAYNIDDLKRLKAKSIKIGNRYFAVINSPKKATSVNQEITEQQAKKLNNGKIPNDLTLTQSENSKKTVNTNGDKAEKSNKSKGLNWFDGAFFIIVSIVIGLGCYLINLLLRKSSKETNKNDPGRKE